LGGSSEPRTERIRNPKIAVSGIEPSVSRDRQFYLYLWATFSSPTRCIHNHQDELRVSSLVPEIEAPAPAPTPPGSGRGFLFSWRRPDQPASRHRTADAHFRGISSDYEIG
jgi:hypothetical protein